MSRALHTVAYAASMGPNVSILPERIKVGELQLASFRTSGRVSVVVNEVNSEQQTPWLLLYRRTASYCSNRDPFPLQSTCISGAVALENTSEC